MNIFATYLALKKVKKRRKGQHISSVLRQKFFHMQLFVYVCQPAAAAAAAELFVSASFFPGFRQIWVEVAALPLRWFATYFMGHEKVWSTGKGRNVTFFSSDRVYLICLIRKTQSSSSAKTPTILFMAKKKSTLSGGIHLQQGLHFLGTRVFFPWGWGCQYVTYFPRRRFRVRCSI